MEAGSLQAGAGLRMVDTLMERASVRPRSTVSRASGSWVTKAADAAMRSVMVSTSCGVSSKQAPGTTMIEFSPECASRRMAAAPVAVVVVSRWRVSMPSVLYRSRARSPKGSLPSLLMKLTRAPARAAATAWLEPLPPGPSWKELPMKVSPHAGSFSVRNARSATKLPMTVTHCADIRQCYAEIGGTHISESRCGAPEFARMDNGTEQRGAFLPMTYQKIRKAVFPAAGMGTRFLPATKSIPKEMLCLVDKPLIRSEEHTSEL